MVTFRRLPSSAWRYQSGVNPRRGCALLARWRLVAGGRAPVRFIICNDALKDSTHIHPWPHPALAMLSVLALPSGRSTRGALPSLLSVGLLAASLMLWRKRGTIALLAWILLIRMHKTSLTTPGVLLLKISLSVQIHMNMRSLRSM